MDIQEIEASKTLKDRLDAIIEDFDQHPEGMDLSGEMEDSTFVVDCLKVFNVLMLWSPAALRMTLKILDEFEKEREDAS